VRVTDDGDITVAPGDAVTAVPYAEAKSDDISLVELTNAVLKRRSFIGRCIFWTGLSIGLIVWAWPYSYTVTVAFTPQGAGSSSGLAGLSGLAAQFGVAVPNLSAGPTPDLYVALLTTPQFLLPAIQTRYVFRDGGIRQSATYVDLYDIEGDTPGREYDKALTKLIGQMSVSANDVTGVVTVAVTTKWPGLSTLMAQKFLQMVDSFNLATRQQQAQELEVFTTRRLAQTQAELTATEDSLARFLAANKDFSRSPYLELEQSRLQRDISFKQAVYTTLVQTYEQSRIDAVRNTPSIVVVQPALMPLVPDPKHGKIKLAVALVFGGVLGVGWSLASHVMVQGSTKNAREVEELNATLVGLKAEARSLPKRVWGWRHLPAQLAGRIRAWRSRRRDIT